MKLIFRFVVKHITSKVKYKLYKIEKGIYSQENQLNLTKIHFKSSSLIKHSFEIKIARGYVII